MSAVAFISTLWGFSSSSNLYIASQEAEPLSDVHGVSVNKGGISVTSLAEAAGLGGEMGFLDFFVALDISEELCLFGLACEIRRTTSKKGQSCHNTREM